MEPTWPARRLAAAIASKQLASRELLQTFLDRIERFNPALNAVVTLDAERAMQAASAADQAVAQGRALGPLHGLPVTIKDAIEVAGLRSTGGAAELSGHVPQTDAVAVSRLRAAGAIVFGKTNVPRWSSDIQTYNELFGTTSNPWDPARTPGGSSGGAATAVAAGLTSFELGTDIADSVRIPAHFCGVFGLKPSFGVIPQRGYLDHVGGGTTDADINVFGPIARHADDLDLLLGVLAGPEPERETAWRLELPPPRRTTLKGMRIGLWLEDPGCPMDREVLALLRAAADLLADAGARIEEAHPPVEGVPAQPAGRDHRPRVRRQRRARSAHGVARMDRADRCGRAAVRGRAGRADRRGIARGGAAGGAVPARPRRDPGRTDGLGGPRRLPAAAEHGQVAVGVSHHTNFPHPMTAGRIDVTATAIHQRRTGHLWQTGSTDADGRLTATGRARPQNAGLRP